MNVEFTQEQYDAIDRIAPRQPQESEAEWLIRLRRETRMVLGISQDLPEWVLWQMHTLAQMEQQTEEVDGR